MLSFNAFWLRWRWALLVAALVVLVLSSGILYPGVWRVMGVGAMAPGFADMEALLAAGDAWVAGYDPFRAPNVFDSYNRPHIYGPGWLVSGACGFTVAHIAEFSVLTVLVFLGSLAYWYRPNSWRTGLGVLAALLAPSILLGLERANNDLIMVVLISVSAALSARQGLVAVMGVILLLATAAWLKIYPVVAGVALLTLPGGLRTVVQRIIAWGLLTTAGFVLYAHDYLRLLRHIPVEKTMFSYDLSYALTISIGGIPGLRLWTWVGTLLAALLFVKILWPHRRACWRALPLTGSWAFLTVSSAAIWVGCLLVNPSYPYRAVWVLPLLAWGASPACHRPVVGRGLCWWLLFFLWVWWMQWQFHYAIYDCHVDFLPVWAAVLGLTHGSVLLTTGLVALMLVGWGWCRIRLLCVGPSVASESLSSSRPD